MLLKTPAQHVATAIFALMFSLTCHPVGAQNPPANPPANTQNNPKFLDGIVASLLVNVLASGTQAVVRHFLADDPVPAATNANPGIGTTAPCYYTAAPAADFSQAAIDELSRAGCQLATRFIGAATQGVESYVSDIVSTAGPMPVPLRYTDGQPNYQGIKVAVELVDETGRRLGERPFGSTFYTGEKFRLKVQSSFAGFLEVLHTNPSGASKRLFPRPELGQFLLNAGETVRLPLNGSIYEFSGGTGDEQLVFIVRDPRVGQENQIAGPVYRQDGATSSFYAQLTPPGQYPYIAQTIHISHQAQP